MAEKLVLGTLAAHNIGGIFFANPLLFTQGRNVSPHPHSELGCHSLTEWLIHPKLADSESFWKLGPTTE